MRKFLLALLLAVLAPLAAAQSIPKPGAKDLCPVCGMLVSKYPNWVAIVTWARPRSSTMAGSTGWRDWKAIPIELAPAASRVPAHR